MAEFTTMEIAFRTRKSERQVQRWIASGKLPAQHIQGNLYEVNEDDLTPFLPREVVTDLVARLASLEQRVQLLEASLTSLSTSPTIAQKHAPRLLREHSGLSASSTLPDGYVAIADLIKQHHAPETTVMRQMRPYLQVGKWKTHEGKTIMYALDPEGIAEFERRYVRT